MDFNINVTTTQMISSVCFFLAIVHIFSAKQFDKISHLYPKDSAWNGFYHILAEIEVVFGIWAAIFLGLMAYIEGFQPTMDYLNTRNFTEPVFVFVIMIVAATRPVLKTVTDIVNYISFKITKIFRLPGIIGFYFIVLAIVPILGSFITEPAAITLAALMLSVKLYSMEISKKLKYITLATLFVNISIGGTLTNFAAPPVLMVAKTWDWSNTFMFTNFGWKAALACILNTLLAIYLCRKELAAVQVEEPRPESDYENIPKFVVAMHFVLLGLIVAAAHYPALLIGLFIVFLGLCVKVYRRYQDRIIYEQAFLVGFFLAGLVILGGMQSWWLQPLLMSMSPTEVMFGAVALGAFTDNAAITYLGSLVVGLTAAFQYLLVAGAVSGGGMTVIANAPNPAAVNILKKDFENHSIEPLSLAKYALAPTLISLAAFYFLPTL